QPGLLKQADGGIVFLDEVADLPLVTQSRLLRVLVDQKFQPVGSTETIKVDVRIVSATTRDLESEIQEGRFREELFHRLNVVPIHVPGLEDRRDDIPALADHFLTLMHKDQGLPRRLLGEDATAVLQSMIWPGNIRQLKNVIERVLILGGSDTEIDPQELPTTDAPAQVDDGRIVLSGALASLSLREARELFEREYLLTQINRFGGNISRTATFVGMERSALHRKLKSLGVITSSRTGSRLARIEGSHSA
ncbi:MAG: sigma 54-interacting transcriptional regulator, partial [Pseudomonadota bacterium]